MTLGGSHKLLILLDFNHGYGIYNFPFQNLLALGPDEC